MDKIDNLKKTLNAGLINEDIAASECLSVLKKTISNHGNKENNTYGLNPEKCILCPFCDYKTSVFDQLKSHIDTIHTIAKFKQCPFCELNNLSQMNLNQHIRAHHWDKLVHKCIECDFRTEKKSYLNAHKRNIHTIIKCHECSICGYRAAIPSRLKYHLASTHKVEKPYHCPMCDYRAAISSTLKTHIMAKHEKKKPHQCPKCKYKATQIGTLHKHIAGHFKSKPYTNKNLNIKDRNLTITERREHEGPQTNFVEDIIDSTNTLRPNQTSKDPPGCEDISSDVKSLLSEFVTFHRKSNPFTFKKCHICCYSATDGSSLNIHLMTMHTDQYLENFSRSNAQTLRMCGLEQ